MPKNKSIKISQVGYIIKKDILSDENIDKIREDLTLKQKETAFNKYDEGVDYYYEDEDCMIVPRYYGLKSVCNRKSKINNNILRNLLQNNIHIETKQRLKFNGSLNKLQKKVAPMILGHKQMNILHNNDNDNCKVRNGGGLIVIPCGQGKTALSLYIACGLGLKTLVIVDRRTLLEKEWDLEIKKFCPDARVGYIYCDKVDVENKDIVICMLKSVYSRQYPLDVFKDFGLLIFDEVDILAAPRIFSVMFRVQCPYMLGLTATPERNDGLGFVVNYMIGPPLVNITPADYDSLGVDTSKMPLHPKVMVHKFKYSDTFIDDVPYIGGGNTPNFSKISRMFQDSTDRNEHIIDIIKSSIEDDDRTILGVCKTIDHCDLLAMFLREEMPEIADKIMAFHSRIIGNSKSKKNLDKREGNIYEKLENAKVVFATKSIIERGVNKVNLDTIILIDQMCSVEQVVGRIMRRKNTNRPLVHDILDAFGPYHGFHGKRRQAYSKMGASIMSSKCDYYIE